MLTLLVGIPGSGKTTYARRRLAEAAANDAVGQVAVVSLETIRRSVFDVDYIPALDVVVWPLLEAQLRILLEDPSREVIVDNMNLRRCVRDRWVGVARELDHDAVAVERRIHPEEAWCRVVERGHPVIARDEFDLLVDRRRKDRAVYGTGGVDRWIRERT